MRTIRLLSGALFLMGAMMAADAGAAELKVVSAEAMKPALQELAPKFEAASKHKLVIAYAPMQPARRRSRRTIRSISRSCQGQHRQADKQRQDTYLPEGAGAGTNPDVVYVAGASLLPRSPWPPRR